MLQIAICDDSDSDRSILSALLGKLLSDEPSEMLQFASCDALISRVKNEYCPDIALLDIEFAGYDQDGIHLAHCLRSILPSCQIIFVTEHLNYAMEVYRTEHVYFVLKSSLDTYLPLALQKARKQLLICNSAPLILEQKGKRLLLGQQDILYIERIGHVTEVHSANQTYSVGEKLDSISKRLAPAIFVRCHKSYLCNLAQVLEFKRTEFVLRTGQIVPISRSYYEDVKSGFTKYKGGLL